MRNILRFHPPYSQHVQTNIGKKFLRLIDEHFPKQHPLGKIITVWCYFWTLVCHVDYLGGVNEVGTVGGGCGGGFPTWQSFQLSGF